MINKRISGSLLLLPIAFWMLSSCTTISYTPKVTLDVSPRTIEKTVQLEKLNDKTPIDDRINPFFGLSVTNDESLTGGLDIEVTNAIVSDFSTNAVFDNISRRESNPDFIIRGEITKFYGKSEMNTFGKVSWGLAMAALIIAPITEEPAVLLGAVPLLTWYLGVPISKNTTEISITLKIYNPDNELIGTYQGVAQEGIQTDIYKNKAFAVPSLTNKNFSNAIQQIRDQIMRDYDKFY